jgi:hypothetical protein
MMLAPQVYAAAGSHVYSRTLDSSAPSAESVRVDFTLDKALAPSPGDARELGIIVSSVGFYD